MFFLTMPKFPKPTYDFFNSDVPLTKQVFSNLEAFKESKKAVKSGIVTVDDIMLLIQSNIVQFYNELVAQFFGPEPVDGERIYRREVVDSVIEDYIPHYKYLFQTLKQLGLVGVCGRGYTFESPRLKMAEQQHDRWIHITFHLMISA